MKLALLLIVSLCLFHLTDARRSKNRNRGPRKSREERLKMRVKKGMFKVCGAIELLDWMMESNESELPETTSLPVEQTTSNGFTAGYSNGPTAGYSNGPTAGYSNGPTAGYSNGPFGVSNAPGMVPVLGSGGGFSQSPSLPVKRGRGRDRNRHRMSRVNETEVVRLLDTGLMDILYETCDNEVFQDARPPMRGSRFARLPDAMKIDKLKGFVVRNTFRLCMFGKRLESMSVNSDYVYLLDEACDFLENSREEPTTTPMPELELSSENPVNARALSHKSDMVLLLTNICRKIFSLDKNAFFSTLHQVLPEDSEMFTKVKEGLTSLCEGLLDVITKGHSS